jgi:hypothetical protein
LWRDKFFEASFSCRESQEKLVRLEKRHQRAAREQERLELEFATTRNEGGDGALGEDQFAHSHAELQLCSPWHSSELLRLRHSVFVAALGVHRAFADCAVEPIRHHLGILMESLTLDGFGDEKRDLLIPDVWSTLFLLVPVVSTTFASVSRMFAGLTPESLGWLLIKPVRHFPKLLSEL